MSASSILHEMARRGIRLMPNGDRLEFEPASRLTTADIERLREHKPELLRLLSPPKATELGCWRCGSAGLVDGRTGLWCGGCERLAWRVVHDSIVRADCEPVDFESQPEVTECVRCGAIERRWCAWGVERCARCEPGRSDRLVDLGRLMKARARLRFGE